MAGSRITLQAPTKIRGIALEAERLGAADTCDGLAMCGLDLNTRVDQLF